MLYEKLTSLLGSELQKPQANQTVRDRAFSEKEKNNDCFHLSVVTADLTGSLTGSKSEKPAKKLLEGSPEFLGFADTITLK